jgi:hypothetical protein
MPIIVTCGKCSKSHRVRNDAVGKSFKCKGCRRSLKVVAEVSKPEDDGQDENATTTSGESESEQDSRDVAELARELASYPDAPPPQTKSERVVPIIIAVVAAVPGCITFGFAYQDSGSILGGFVLGLCAFGLVAAIPAVFYAGVQANRLNEQRYDLVRRTSLRLGLGLDQFHLTTLGRTPLLTNLQTRKEEGTNVAVFDYQQEIQAGKATYTTQETVVWLRRTGTRLPEFAIRPGAESWLGRDLFEVFTGPTDINFESHPEFSRHYYLRGDDEEAIRKLFHKGVLEFFEQQEGLIVECCGNKLLIYRDMVSVEPDHRRPLIEDALQLMALLLRRPRTPKRPFDKSVQESDVAKNGSRQELPKASVSWPPDFVDPPKSLSLKKRITGFAVGLLFVGISASNLIPIVMFVKDFQASHDWLDILFVPVLVLGLGVMGVAALLIGAFAMWFAVSGTPDVRTEPKAPKFSADALVCQFGHTAVIVDHDAGLIHFRRCHRLRGSWRIRGQSWFTCPRTDVLRIYYKGNRGSRGSLTQFIIETRTGSATVPRNVSNYAALCEYLAQILVT